MNSPLSQVSFPTGQQIQIPFSATENSLPDIWITVAITAWREGHWLKEAFESVLGQTEQGWELVLILDGNSDPDTQKVFESLSHPRLRKQVLSQQMGPYQARTQAIQLTLTPWFYGLDADDLLPPQALELMKNTLQAQPQAQFLFGDVVHFDKEQSKVLRYPTFDITKLNQGGIINGQSPYKISLFNQLGGFCTELFQGGADLDFWIAVYELGAQGVRVDGIIYHRRLHSQNVGTRTGGLYEYKMNILFARHKVFEKLPHLKNQFMLFTYQKMALYHSSQNQPQKASIYAKKALGLGALDSRTRRIYWAGTRLGLFISSCKNLFRSKKTK